MTQSNGMQGRFPEYFATTVCLCFVLQGVYMSVTTPYFLDICLNMKLIKKTFSFIFKAVLNAHYKLLFLVPEIWFIQ